MKRISAIGFTVLCIAIALSCTKDKIVTTPAAAQVNASLLAGAAGSSTTWKIVLMSQTKNGVADGTLSPGDGYLPACESDNRFQFSNNVSQDYQVTEGAVNCNPGVDSTIVEKGSWAFTNDGKSLIIDGSVFVSSTQLSSPSDPYIGYMILNQGTPLTVVSLTATTLTVSYGFTYNSDKYVVTLKFAKV